MTRALVATRLSRSDDDSTSLIRQDKAAAKAIKERGWQVAGTATDDGVSASKIGPFDRPDLGKWLTDPKLIRSYDVIVWWRLDRAVRSMRDLHALAGWARDNKKRLVFAEGPGGGSMELDMTNPISELIVTILAFAAQMEAQSIKERVQSSHDYLATQPRWPGGTAPYGYRTVDREGGGKTLEVVPEEAKTIRGIVSEIISGKSLSAVAVKLNTSGVQTTLAEFRKTEGTSQWAPASLGKMLRSVRLMGHKEAKGHPVLDANGEAVILADEIIDAATFRRLQAALDERSLHKTRTQSTSPLLGVVFCGECGGPAYRRPERIDKDGQKRRGLYRCYGNERGGVKACAGVRLPEVELMSRIDQMFMENVGPFDRPEREFIAGNDYAGELDSIKRAMARLRGESDAGLIEDEEDYFRRLSALQSRQQKLSALPQHEDRWEEMPSGKTWGMWWQESDVEAQRELMLSAGFKVWLLPGGDSVAYWPGKSDMTVEEFLETLKA